MAAGTVTHTATKLHGGVVQHSLVWVSAASGIVSGAAVNVSPGTIVEVEFIPDSGGTQPSDLYDVSLLNEHGVNVFDDGAGASVGANLSNATASTKLPFIGGGAVTYVRRWLHGGALELVVTNAGSAKGGTVNVYKLPGVV